MGENGKQAAHILDFCSFFIKVYGDLWRRFLNLMEEGLTIIEINEQ